MNMLRIFIGYDPNETVAFHVLSHSIMARASVPVQITPLILSQLPLTRARGHGQSTEFSFSRFLVPWLCSFEGRALFCDCDQLFRCDVAEVFAQARSGCAVTVVKHDYVPKTARKFLDQPQTTYQKKNWSSVMLFDNMRCRALTPEYVNTASGLELHQFHWASSIGEMPRDFNHLVGEYPENPDAKVIHFTLGTPIFGGFHDCEYAKEWYNERSQMMHFNRFLQGSPAD